MDKSKYIGSIFKTTEGYDIKIIEYYRTDNVVVEFLDTGHRLTTQMSHVRRGGIKNPYHKSVYGVGYFGKNRSSKGSESDRGIYNVWHGILRRCYSDEAETKFPSYKGCVVCDEWHNFQNFSKWYKDNCYEIEEILEVDKDILVKGNKVYSPETCVLVPCFINLIFTKRKANRGDCVLGVRKDPVCKNNYIAEISCYGKSSYIGYYDNEFEAFVAYKKAKEEYIKQVAYCYKDKIPHKLYEALCKYEVEFAD